MNKLAILQRFVTRGLVGNRWFKVNLHAHGEKSDPAEIVKKAREADVDILAITDHQTFQYCDPIIEAATTPGRALTVLPGMEITTQEGVHLLAIFPSDYSRQREFLGWLEIPGTGDTRKASRRRVEQIFRKVNEENGIVVVPHPYTPKIGALDGSRKVSTKEEWLETGLFRLTQIAPEKVSYVEYDDDGNFVNRYVLSSAKRKHIASSTYCLAPFNRSDAHSAEEVPDGCSWFRMEQPTIAGLKQVTCEPRTRISRNKPPESTHDSIVGLRVSGGYCDQQIFEFNQGLNVLIGQNHAGKSAVFDFIRFAFCHEESLRDDSRQLFLARLYGILQPGSTVDLYLLQQGTYYVVTRTFNPETTGESEDLKVLRCLDDPLVYRYDAAQGQLVPEEHLEFPIDAYEQGRIGRLRRDLARQLEMLDEFAGLQNRKQERDDTVRQLTRSAEALKPLYGERETFNSKVAALSDLRKDLGDKSKLLPNDEEEERWAKAAGAVQTIEDVISELSAAGAAIPDPSAKEPIYPQTNLERLFGQRVPEVEFDEVADAETLRKWVNAVKDCLSQIERARNTVVQAVRSLATSSASPRATWQDKQQAHDTEIAKTLAKVGIQSPQELIARVKWLRKEIAAIEQTFQPQLAKTNSLIARKETEREGLLTKLKQLNREITEKRTLKTKELTEALGENIQVSVDPAGSRSEYGKVLHELCRRITTTESRIHNRDGQIAQIRKTIIPLDLADALANKGQVRGPDATSTPLYKVCGITENTQNVLCHIADDIQLLNKLQTVPIIDVPRIRVRRRGEKEYADLRTGLSQGEQSAAILTLALHTRTRPLILDQPEDELGYSYVVHLVVPRILRAKSSRQVLIVTHDANIPVLGDADYVIKMQNLPSQDTGRRCTIASAGCFESPVTTQALVELEGGAQAFQFRQHRYALSDK